MNGIEEFWLLPGASGNIELWRPLSNLLPLPQPRHFVSWPGFGGAAPDPSVHGLSDLVARVAGS
ncbi:MAG: hypothetical protein QM756_07970, partial [Polyangiaceae bacterium]